MTIRRQYWFVVHTLKSQTERVGSFDADNIPVDDRQLHSTAICKAREAAGEARAIVRAGKNPIIERKLGGLKKAGTPLFKDFAER